MKNINISIREQRLTVTEGETPIRSYPVSTSRFGIGTEEGSMKTPTGRFRVAQKIGDGLPSDVVFQSRVPLKPGDGLDEHNANTRDRFIYIHGTKHEDKIGSPASHGCIRMRNIDIVDLFELVDEDAHITIEE